MQITQPDYNRNINFKMPRIQTNPDIGIVPILKTPTINESINISNVSSEAKIIV